MYDVPLKLIFVVAVNVVVPVAPMEVVPRFAHEMLFAFMVRLWKGVFPPVVPPIEMSPLPAWILRLRPATSPSTVPVIEMVPLLVAKVLVAVITTFPVSVMPAPPVVVVMPPPT